MRLLHCADLHLDSKLNANLDKDKAKERKRELLKTFTRMVDYAKTHDVDAILICGDLFDTKNISALARNTFKDMVLGNPEILFFYIRGNHDESVLVNTFDETPDNLYLFNDVWSSYVLGEKNNVFIHGVELSDENSTAMQNNFAPDPSKINIVMLHGQEQEAIAKDKSEIINLKLFRNKGINYLALGHVHEYKRAILDGGCVYCYPGCLEGRGFDETGEHGFVILDVNEETGEVTDTFVPFAYRKLFEIDVFVTGIDNTPDMIKAVKKALNESNASKDDLIKVVLRGDVDVECEKDIDFIKHTFEPDFYFVKVYDRTAIKVDINDFLLDSSLKGEFVRCVFDDNSLSEEDKGEIIRIGLNVLWGGKPER